MDEIRFVNLSQVIEEERGTALMTVALPVRT